MPNYPKSYEALLNEPDPKPDSFFEPALEHYSSAFRFGDPVIEDPVQLQRWQQARREVSRHLLRVFLASHHKDALVLRGSLLLKVWFGEQAREPGDIDWIYQITPGETYNSARIASDFLELIRQSQLAHQDVRIDIDRIAIDEIWRYGGRAPGHRISVLWKCGDLPIGNMTIDIAFGEKLFQPPITTLFQDTDPPLAVPTATPELSLAWKLAWLIADGAPQGKDLYDAVLLAENTSFSLDLFQKVYYEMEDCFIEVFPLNNLRVQWDLFKKEYPWVPGTLEDWRERLSLAVLPQVPPSFRPTPKTD